MRHCHLLSKGGRKKFQLLVLLEFTDLTVSLSEPLEPEFFMGLTVKKRGSTSDKISEVFLRGFGPTEYLIKLKSYQCVIT